MPRSKQEAQKRKKRVRMVKEAPFPVCLPSTSGPPATAGTHLYYTGYIKGTTVVIEHSGDIDFLHIMGFFGKGSLSRSQANFHERKHKVNIQIPSKESSQPLKTESSQSLKTVQCAVMSKRSYLAHRRYKALAEGRTKEFNEIVCFEEEQLGLADSSEEDRDDEDDDDSENDTIRENYLKIGRIQAFKLLNPRSTLSLVGESERETSSTLMDLNDLSYVNKHIKPHLVSILSEVSNLSNEKITSFLKVPQNMAQLEKKYSAMRAAEINVLKQMCTVQLPRSKFKNGEVITLDEDESAESAKFTPNNVNDAVVILDSDDEKMTQAEVKNDISNTSTMTQNHDGLEVLDAELPRVDNSSRGKREISNDASSACGVQGNLVKANVMDWDLDDPGDTEFWKGTKEDASGNGEHPVSVHMSFETDHSEEHLDKKDNNDGSKSESVKSAEDISDLNKTSMVKDKNAIEDEVINDTCSPGAGLELCQKMAEQSQGCANINSVQSAFVKSDLSRKEDGENCLVISDGECFSGLAQANCGILSTADENKLKDPIEKITTDASFPVNHQENFAPENCENEGTRVEFENNDLMKVRELLSEPFDIGLNEDALHLNKNASVVPEKQNIEEANSDQQLIENSRPDTNVYEASLNKRPLEDSSQGKQCPEDFSLNEQLQQNFSQDKHSLKNSSSDKQPLNNFSPGRPVEDSSSNEQLKDSGLEKQPLEVSSPDSQLLEDSDLNKQTMEDSNKGKQVIQEFSSNEQPQEDSITGKQLLEQSGLSPEASRTNKHSDDDDKNSCLPDCLPKLGVAGTWFNTENPGSLQNSTPEINLHNTTADENHKVQVHAVQSSSGETSLRFNNENKPNVSEGSNVKSVIILDDDLKENASLAFGDKPESKNLHKDADGNRINAENDNSNDSDDVICIESKSAEPKSLHSFLSQATKPCTKHAVTRSVTFMSNITNQPTYVSASVGFSSWDSILHFNFTGDPSHLPTAMAVSLPSSEGGNSSARGDESVSSVYERIYPPILSLIPSSNSQGAVIKQRGRGLPCLGSAFLKITSGIPNISTSNTSLHGAGSQSQHSGVNISSSKHFVSRSKTYTQVLAPWSSTATLASSRPLQPLSTLHSPSSSSSSSSSLAHSDVTALQLCTYLTAYQHRESPDLLSLSHSEPSHMVNNDSSVTSSQLDPSVMFPSLAAVLKTIEHFHSKTEKVVSGENKVKSHSNIDTALSDFHKTLTQHLSCIKITTAAELTCLRLLLALHQASTDALREKIEELKHSLSSFQNWMLKKRLEHLQQRQQTLLGTTNDVEEVMVVDLTENSGSKTCPLPINACPNIVSECQTEGSSLSLHVESKDLEKQWDKCEGTEVSSNDKDAQGNKLVAKSSSEENEEADMMDVESRKRKLQNSDKVNENIQKKLRTNEALDETSTPGLSNTNKTDNLIDNKDNSGSQGNKDTSNNLDNHGKSVLDSTDTVVCLSTELQQVGKAEETIGDLVNSCENKSKEEQISSDFIDNVLTSDNNSIHGAQLSSVVGNKKTKTDLSAETDSIVESQTSQMLNSQSCATYDDISPSPHSKQLLHSEELSGSCQPSKLNGTSPLKSGSFITIDDDTTGNLNDDVIISKIDHPNESLEMSSSCNILFCREGKFCTLHTPLALSGRPSNAAMTREENTQEGVNASLRVSKTSSTYGFNVSKSPLKATPAEASNVWRGEGKAQQTNSREDLHICIESSSEDERIPHPPKKPRSGRTSGLSLISYNIHPYSVGDESDGEMFVVANTSDDDDDDEEEEEEKYEDNGDSSMLTMKRQMKWRPCLKRDPYPAEERLHLMLEEAFFLSFGLGCLRILDPEMKLLNITQTWQQFQSLKEQFTSHYVAYHYFRSKGWVPKSGLKFGCDFILYREGPPFYHGSYSVVVTTVSESTLMPCTEDDGSSSNHRQLSWISLSGLNRITEHVAKELMLCYVIWPKNLTKEDTLSPECISKFRVKEVIVSRWVSSQERENKTDEEEMP